MHRQTRPDRQPDKRTDRQINTNGNGKNALKQKLQEIVVAFLPFPSFFLGCSISDLFTVLRYLASSKRFPQGSPSPFYVLRRIEKPHANKICLSLLFSFEPGYRTQDPSLLCCLLVFVVSIFQSRLVSSRPHSYFPYTRFCLILKYLQFCGFPLNAIPTSTFIL